MASVSELASVIEAEKAVQDAQDAQDLIVDTWVEEDKPEFDGDNPKPRGIELLAEYNAAAATLKEATEALEALEAGVTTTNPLSVTTNTGRYASNADKNPVHHIGPAGETIAASTDSSIKVYTAENTTLVSDIQGTPGDDTVVYGAEGAGVVDGEKIYKLHWKAILEVAEQEIVRRNKKVETFTELGGGSTSTRKTGSLDFTVINDTDTNWYFESDTIKSRYTYGHMFGLGLSAAAVLLKENYRVLPIDVIHKEDIDYMLSKFEQTGYTNSISNVDTSNSAKITATEFNQIVNKLKAAGQECICNCNYCTCNCNYCTCNCNYACTCNCNYSDKQLKTEIIFL